MASPEVHMRFAEKGVSKKLDNKISLKNVAGEVDVFSHTQYSISDDCVCKTVPFSIRSIYIEPDDIDVSNTATFVWEIK
ncbi:MAG: hypothetical protein LUH54_03235 [Firmicutes bacterium]|nr:hypothetical protein [Bacillota bacterium]